MHLVWFQVAAFGPFVPAVDIEYPWPVRPGKEALLGSLQRLAESFGGVAANREGERIAKVAELIALDACADWNPIPS